MSLLGLLLVYGFPALFGAAFWALVSVYSRHLRARDVMASLRPSRQRVADTDRRIDDLHYQVVVGS